MVQGQPGEAGQHSVGDGASVRESKGDVTVIPRLTVSSQSEA